MAEYEPIEFIDQPNPLSGDPEDPRVNAENLNHIQTQYEEVLAEVEGGDGPIADALRAAYAYKPTGPVKLFDIRDYLDGDPLPNDGTTDASLLIQSVMNIANEWYEENATIGGSFSANPIPAQVYCPEGAYRLVYELDALNGVGLAGAGVNLTFWLPEGNNSCMFGPLYDEEPEDGWEDTMLNDQVFTDGTIDGINQTASAGFGGTKGLYWQNARRLRFQNFRIRNSFASSYGIDFIIDGYAVDSWVENGGRGQGTDANEQGPTTSGFAPGTGRFENESMIWVNCHASGCEFGAGWLFEQLPGRGATLRPGRFTLIGCSSTGNKYGISDLGIGGLLAIGTDLSNNTHSGIFVAGTGVRDSGQRGRLVDCNLSDNGGNAYGPAPSGNGIVFAYGSNPDDYELIDCHVLRNTVCGILVDATCEPELGGLRISGGLIGMNPRGIKVGNVVKRLPGFKVKDTVFLDNTTADITIEGGLVAPEFVDVTFKGSTVRPNFVWSSSHPATKSKVRGARFINQTTPHTNTPTDQTRWGDNESISLIEPAVAALAGTAPVFVFNEKSGNTHNIVGLSWNSAQDSTTYLAVDVTPTGNDSIVLLRNSSNDAVIIGARQSGNAAWLGRGRNLDGTTIISNVVTSSAVPGVLCIVRTQTAISTYLYGGSSDTDTMTGWPPAPTVTNVQLSARAVYATTFEGAHDGTKRGNIMAALAAEFITI